MSSAHDGGTTDTSGSTEVMLDIEMIMAVANPQTIYVYTGPNSTAGVSILIRMGNNPAPL